MKLSEVRFIRLYKFIDGTRNIKINKSVVKVNYAMYQGVFDTENPQQLQWALHKIKHGGWIPFANGTLPGINKPLELDDCYQSPDTKDFYEAFDPEGYAISQGLLKIADKYLSHDKEKIKNDIINQRFSEDELKFLEKLVYKYQRNEKIPEIFINDVKEYLRQKDARNKNKLE